MSSDHNPPPGAHAIVERVDRAALADRMIADVCAAIPSYAAMAHGELTGRIRPVVSRSIDVVLDWATLGVTTRTGDLGFIDASAEISATNDIPLADVLDAYQRSAQIGITTLYDLSGPGEQRAVIALAEFVRDYIHAICASVSSAYADNRGELLRRRDRAAAALVAALVEGRGDTVSHVDPELGFVPSPRLGALVVVLPGRTPAAHRELADRLRSRTSLVFASYDHVSDVTSESFDAADLHLPEEAIIVTATATSRPRLDTALEQVRILSGIAEARGARGIVRVEDHELELVLVGSPQLATWLRDRVARPLSGPEHDNLRRTLRALVEHDFDRAETSKALRVHRNTLGHRLKRIEELTNLDIRDAQDSALAVLAVTGAIVR